MRVLFLPTFFSTILPFIFPTALRDDPIRVWHCENTDIRQVVDNSFELYQNNVDSILYYLKGTLPRIFDAYGGEWMISVSLINDTYDYIDDNDRRSRWFCTIYDAQYRVLIIVIRMHPVSS